MSTAGPSTAEGEHYGRYEIINKLASGGMGEVFLARSVGVAGFQKFVVIKKILPHLLEQPQFVEGLVREAKLLVMLDHPNIVQVLDLGVEGKDYFMAMEFVNGYNMATIAHYCAQKRVLIPPNAVVAIGLSVLEGLDYAHQLTTPDGHRQNIIHRDVSPQNVMISRDGRVKLTDFGIAKVLNEAEGEFTQSLKGKFRYMAPEAVDGGRVDRRYDIFASGILMFEGLCRRHLFGGRSDVDILNQVREARVPPIERYHPGVAKGIVEATRKALVRNPDKRYQSAAQFARDLREAIKPASEADAQRELSAFVAELYERSDFPINKPKLPDLQAVELEATRSLVLESHLSEQRGLADTVASAPNGVVTSGGRARGNVLVQGAILLMLLGLSGAVGYLFLTGPGRTGGAGEGTQKDATPVVKIVVNRAEAMAASDAGVRPAADSRLRMRASSPDAGRRTGRHVRRPKCVPVVFDAAAGGRALRARRGALGACILKHAQAGQIVDLKWQILRSGRIDRCVVEPPAVAATPLGRCLLRVGARIKFPCHSQAVVTFRQRLRAASVGATPTPAGP